MRVYLSKVKGVLVIICLGGWWAGLVKTRPQQSAIDNNNSYQIYSGKNLLEFPVFLLIKCDLMFIEVKDIDKYVVPETTTTQKKSDLSCLCKEQP